MNTSTITITVPDEIRTFVERQAADQGYESVSAFIDDMIRTLQGLNGLTLEDIRAIQPDAELIAHLQKPDVKADLETKLLEGLNSPSVIVDDAFWESRRQALRDRHPEIDFDS